MVTTSEPVTVERWHELSLGLTSCAKRHASDAMRGGIYAACAHLRGVDLEQAAADQAPHEQRLHVNLDFGGVHEAADSNFKHDRATIGAVVERVLKRAFVFLAIAFWGSARAKHDSRAART